MELVQFGSFPWVFYVQLFFSYSLNIFHYLLAQDMTDTSGFMKKMALLNHPSKAHVMLQIFFVVNHCDKLEFGKNIRKL